MITQQVSFPPKWEKSASEAVNKGERNVDEIENKGEGSTEKKRVRLFPIIIIIVCSCRYVLFSDLLEF